MKGKYTWLTDHWSRLTKLPVSLVAHPRRDRTKEYGVLGAQVHLSCNVLVREVLVRFSSLVVAHLGVTPTPPFFFSEEPNTEKDH